MRFYDMYLRHYGPFFCQLSALLVKVHQLSIFVLKLRFGLCQKSMHVTIIREDNNESLPLFTDIFQNEKIDISFPYLLNSVLFSE